MGYFVLGHFLHSFLDSKKINKFIPILGLLFGVGCTAIIDGLDALKNNEASVLVNTPFSLPMLIASASIFLLGKLCVKDTLILKTSLISIFSKLTFGIYLLHPFVIKIFMKLGMNTTIPHTCIMIPIFTLLVYLVTGALVFVLSKIPLINKLIK